MTAVHHPAGGDQRQGGDDRSRRPGQGAGARAAGAAVGKRTAMGARLAALHENAVGAVASGEPCRVGGRDGDRTSEPVRCKAPVRWREGQPNLKPTIGTGSARREDICSAQASSPRTRSPTATPSPTASASDAP